MSLPHALLTALIDRPDSGSELASRFDRSLGHFWAATHQQIYRELARMEEAGWVAPLPEQGGRGRKRAYRVTRRGRTELVRWIGEPLAPRPLREELMVRLRAEGAVGPTGGALAEHIRAWLAQHEATQALYDQIEARDFQHAQPTREQRLQHLVLRAGQRYEAMWIELAREMLEVLETDRPCDSDEKPIKRRTSKRKPLQE